MTTIQSQRRSVMQEEKRVESSAASQQVGIGDEIQVWWDVDRVYYDATVMRELPSGRHKLFYEDGTIEHINLGRETWRFRTTREEARKLLEGAPLLNGDTPAASDDERDASKSSKWKINVLTRRKDIRRPKEGNGEELRDGDEVLSEGCGARGLWSSPDEREMVGTRDAARRTRSGKAYRL